MPCAAQEPVLRHACLATPTGKPGKPFARLCWVETTASQIRAKAAQLGAVGLVPVEAYPFEDPSLIETVPEVWGINIEDGGTYVMIYHSRSVQRQPEVHCAWLCHAIAW